MTKNSSAFEVEEFNQSLEPQEEFLDVRQRVCVAVAEFRDDRSASLLGKTLACAELSRTPETFGGSEGYRRC
jgi:hypothetical protein